MVPYDKKEQNHGSNKESIGEHVLVLHNDNVNTFDDVIDALMACCLHNSEQAEQCATLTHYKGHCEIKRGTYNELTDLQKMLTEKSLKVSID